MCIVTCKATLVTKPEGGSNPGLHRRLDGQTKRGVRVCRSTTQPKEGRKFRQLLQHGWTWSEISQSDAKGQILRAFTSIKHLESWHSQRPKAEQWQAGARGGRRGKCFADAKLPSGMKKKFWGWTAGMAACVTWTCLTLLNCTLKNGRNVKSRV